MNKKPYRIKTRNRILAGLLSMLIILQSVPKFCLTALAQEEPGSQKSTEYVLQVNGSSAATANQMKIRYGQNITLSLAGLQDGESVKFYYASKEMVLEEEFEPIGNGSCTLTPGFYYLRYSVTQESMEVESQTTDFAITVEKAALAAPGDLTWTGSQISWSAPTGTTDSYSAAELISTCEAIAGYELCVYKNGNCEYEKDKISGRAALQDILQQRNRRAGAGHFVNRAGILLWRKGTDSSVGNSRDFQMIMKLLIIEKPWMMARPLGNDREKVGVIKSPDHPLKKESQSHLRMRK